MAVLGAPVFPHGNLAFFVAIFSEMTRLSAGVGLRLHSIHPSITRESKWRWGTAATYFGNFPEKSTAKSASSTQWETGATKITIILLF